MFVVSDVCRCIATTHLLSTWTQCVSNQRKECSFCLFNLLMVLLIVSLYLSMLHPLNISLSLSYWYLTHILHSKAGCINI